MDEENNGQHLLNAEYDYTITEGLRKESKLFLSENFCYSKKRHSSQKLYLACILASKLCCSASAIIKKSNDRLILQRKHNHSPDAYDFEMRNLKKRLKIESAKSVQSIRDIFDDICRSIPEAAVRTNFKNNARTMRNYRRKRNASATVSSVRSLSPHASLSQPTNAKFQKKTQSRFENQCFENRDQKAMTHSVQPSLPPGTQMQVQQHLQVVAPLPAPSQPAPSQVQRLVHPVKRAVVKPKPEEKPQPPKKQLLAVSNHHRHVMSSLANLWKSGKLCDAGISNGSTTVKVHKLVLSAVCPKLLSVFNVDIMSHKFLQVNFPETVSAEALNAFGEYMYNGILDLDWDILEQLKIIAKRLDMEEFEQLCDSHLPNQKHQSASAAASFNNVPLIQKSMPIRAMTSSLAFPISAPVRSAQPITTQAIDIKQKISAAELAQVRKKAATAFCQEVPSLAPNKPGNAAGFVISPGIKTEPVGPEDDKYSHWSRSRSHRAFTSTNSSSSSIITASTSTLSVPVSSTEYSIPFSETTDVKSIRLKASHSYEAPLISDLSPVSGIVETMRSQSSSMNEDSSKPLDSRLSVSLSNSNDTIYPVRLFSARGGNLPILKTDSSDAMSVISFKTSEKT